MLSARRPSVLILVVEDDAGLREVYRSTLMGAGYAVAAVEDGIDALRRLDRTPVPSAVVLDLALPRLSGRDVGSELKSRPETSHIPIIVVTGTDSSDLDALDFECVMRKPISPEELVEAVENCLRKARRAWT